MKIKLLLLSLLISFSTFSQKSSYKKMMKDNKINFYDVVKEAEKYFSTHDKNKKGSGYKPFMRWVHNNEYKYYPSGDRSKEDPLLLKHAYQTYINSTALYRRNANPVGSWNELGPREIDSITGHYSIGLGRVIDVMSVTQDTLFLSSEAGGLWKTTDGGQTWNPKSDNLIASGADAIAFSPFNHSKMYMDVQNPGNYYSYGIYRSNDGGETWSESNFNPVNVGFGGLGDDFKIFTIKCHPTINNLIFIGTNRGLYISQDDLQTWTRIHTIFDGANYAEIQSIAFHPTDPNTIYIMDNERWSADKSKIYITHDLGQNWATSSQFVDNNGDPNDRNAYLETSIQCPDCVYLASNKGLWKSTNQGADFTFISKPNQGMVEGFAVNKDNPDNMIYGYLDVMNTTDGGANWNQVTYWSLGNSNGTGSTYGEKLASATNYVHADLHPAKYQNGHFYIGTDGFMCKSADGGQNWEIISYGTGIRENYRLGVCQSDMDAVIVGSQDNGNSLHTNHGWVEITGGDGMEGIMLPANNKAFIGSYQHGSRFRSFDEDVSRDVVTPPCGDNAFWTAPLAYDPNDQFTIYDFRGGVWKSTDFGSNWTQLNSDLFGTGYWDNIRLAEIAQNNSQIMLIANRDDLKKSIDGGNTFTDISGLPNLYITDVAFAPHDDNIMFTTYGNYNHPADKIYMSIDGGASWQNITYNLNGIPVHSIVVDNTPEHNMYAGTELGVFYKGFSDTTWQPLHTNLPKVKVSEMEIHQGSNTLFVSSWGRGLWQTKLVGRDSYPEIQKVSINNAPTLTMPKQGMDEYVTATINYTGNLSQVQVKYSVNNTNLDQTISMSNISGNIWKSDNPLPTTSVDDKVFYTVEATGDHNDTTTNYMLMYTVHPFEYCTASGDNPSELRFTNISIVDDNNQTVLDNSTAYADYTFFDSSVISLEAGKTYTINISSYRDWHENDYSGWIDYNNDAEFSIDERIIYNIDADGNTSAQFTIPTDKTLNTNVRMRLRLSNWGTTPSPCGEGVFGEVEDYVVKIVDSTPPVFDINPLPDLTAQCEITTLTPPTATDAVAGQVTGTTTIALPISTQGTTVVTWTYDDGNGNSVTQTQNVIIDDTTNPVPDATSLSDITAECEVTSLTAPTATDNCAGSITATHDATLPISTQGTTVVTWTYDDGNGNSVTQTQNVVINPIDNTVNQSGFTLTANATGAYTYQWGDCSNGFTAIAGETNQSFTPSLDGDYAVQISNGTCSVTSNCINITGLSLEQLAKMGIKIYPNPSTGLFTIEMENKNASMQIFDITGKLIWKHQTQNNKTRVDIQKFAKGIYLLRINKGQKNYNVHIIKK